jgi:precorrin-4 methylase
MRHQCNHALACAVFSFVAAAASAEPGRFYIVGMGVAPDLITLRAVKVLQKVDVFVLADERDAGLWKEYVQDKPVWVAPRHICLCMTSKTAEEEKTDPVCVEQARKYARARRDLIDRITAAVRQGKIVAALEAGDPMMYGMTWYTEVLPADVQTEIIPGVGAFQAASAAVKMSPPYGWDTNAVILTMSDWPGRADTNESLMQHGTSMIFYTMHLDYPKLFEQLARHYPADTPVAAVSNAGVPGHEKIVRATVGTFMKQVDTKELSKEMHMLMVGKFLNVGQARKDGLEAGKAYMEEMSKSNARYVGQK